jgi:hypothetical protein
MGSTLSDRPPPRHLGFTGTGRRRSVMSRNTLAMKPLPE